MATNYTLLSLLFLLPLITALQTAEFLHCMSTAKHPNLSTYIFSPNSSTYINRLISSEQNSRWLRSISLRPKLIVTPHHNDHIKATIICSKKQGLHIRVMSGGHDYEGLSFRSKTPFVLIDLINLRSIKIDLKKEIAWVQTGASLGELYYNIAKLSDVHAFPAGLYPSVGVGGHISGGGIGTMLRKHGLATDNIIDARFMNWEGKVFNRKSMGEDLFWAIRGGGGASFGVILEWKMRLVRVPKVVTAFNVKMSLNDVGIQLLDKWQHIASSLPDDLFIRVLLTYFPPQGQKTTAAAAAGLSFNSMFLGSLKELLPLMKRSFPELRLNKTSCTEMSWINSTLFFSNNEGKPLEALLQRTSKSTKNFYKGKSDFLYKPLPKSVYAGIKERLVRGGPKIVIMDPFGGKMERIGESEIPFPHRRGSMINIQYLFNWHEDGDRKKHLGYAKEMYDFMKPHVSSSPRAAFFNYKDLDIGKKRHHNTSYEEAATWGRKYFKGNFERLAKVKKAVDPHNFFRDEQSIPPIS